MAIVRKKSLLKDESGHAYLEFTVVAVVMMTVLFGVIEFSLAYFQWNAATKAMQVGARLAAVSSPVWDDVDLLRGNESGHEAGTPLNNHTLSSGNYGYSVTCSRPNPPTDGTCIENYDNTGLSGGGIDTNMDQAALDTLVFGRNSTQCDDVTAAGAQTLGMCDIYQDIGVENVRITYEHSNLGYSTRPGGMVPTIKLELVNLNFNFIFLDDLLNLGPIQMPGLVTTLAAEDMCSSAPTEDPKWDAPC